MFINIQTRYIVLDFLYSPKYDPTPNAIIPIINTKLKFILDYYLKSPI
jgi:hypothetical protein